MFTWMIGLSMARWPSRTMLIGQSVSSAPSITGAQAQPSRQGRLTPLAATTSAASLAVRQAICCSSVSKPAAALQSNASMTRP